MRRLNNQKALQNKKAKKSLHYRASGVAIATTETGTPEIRVTVNNIADIGTAVGKGFGTGLTFGLAGSNVSDYYEMEVVLIAGNKVFKKTGYKHAIHSTIGNADGPEGLEPMTTSAAFGKVVEQLLLNSLKDIEIDIETNSKSSEYLNTSELLIFNYITASNY